MSSLTLRDTRGREHRFADEPRRIVSLVPSWTETLFELGAGSLVVGATDYCVHPARALAGVPRVGGTKNPNVEEILALRPDAVVANREENRAKTVSELEDAGVPVVVTYARTLDEATAEIAGLGMLSSCRGQAAALVAQIDHARERALAARPVQPRAVAALIWKKPYMAVGPDTFADALLSECGGRNAFARRTERYPRVDAAELCAARPEVILLPTEPYAFEEADRQELLELDTPAGEAGRVHIVEGELLSWYGPRMVRALAEFSALLSA